MPQVALNIVGTVRESFIFRENLVIFRDFVNLVKPLAGTTEMTF